MLWKQAGKQERCQEQYSSHYLFAMLYHRQKALLISPTDYKNQQKAKLFLKNINLKS